MSEVGRYVKQGAEQMNKFVVGQKIRAQFPLRPDLHVDLIRDGDGWRRIDGLGPRVPYRDSEIECVPWSDLDDSGHPVR